MKEKLKVYHGLPKTPINTNVLFHASFDGSVQLTPCSSIVHQGYYIFEPNITGYGIRYPSLSDSNVGLSLGSLNIPVNEFTLDLWFIPKVAVTSAYQGRYIGIGFNNISDDADYYVRFERDVEQTKYHLWSNRNLAIGNFDFTQNNLNKPYHLRICFKVGGYCKLFINGVETCDAYQNVLHPNVTFIDRIDIGGMNASISEVVITKGYNDYDFPTLPQDFIDGKAIVVPSLNQRQSYGDPVLHQVTELVVKNQPFDVFGTIYDLNDKDSDDLERCFTNPELRTAYADGWEQGQAKIRITGLEKSIITGVFDTDTAKCRIVKEVSNSNVIPVDSVSGISVGDSLVYVYSSDFRVGSNTYTVQALDSVNNTITLSSTTNWYVGDYFFETTASSSSPVVKTVEGATVNGTWSGLGTNIATFTLGSNTNIAGKDLVVTYCLNAKGNSSPYPKMPSEVIRGYDELGNELEPVSLVEINDDFKGKLVGDTSNCYHTVKSYAATSFLAPTSSVGSEINQDQYNKLNHPDDYIEVSSTSSAKVQVRFDLDLFKMLEKKLGEEVSLSWVQENVAHIKMNATCKGASYRGNYVEARYYDPKYSDWKLNSSGHSNSTPSFATISATFSGDLIQNKNNCFFMITCSSSDGTTPSYVQIKEVSFNVKLKTGDVYDVLYTKDTSARVSPCNPILIDKQTKEVKRLLPSNAPFSTEVLTYNSGNITSLSNCTLITQSNTHMLTTMGTGSSDPFIENQYRGLLGKLDLAYFNSADYLGEPAYRLPLGADTSKFSLGCKFVLSQAYMENMNFFQISEVLPNVNQLAIKHGIVKKDTELCLRLLVIGIKANSLDYTSSIQYYKLPNRPLIK